MNNQRRRRLQKALDIIQEVRDEEEEAMENLPDNLRDGERGDRMQETIDELEDAHATIERVVEES